MPAGVVGFPFEFAGKSLANQKLRTAADQGKKSGKAEEINGKPELVAAAYVG